MHFTWGSKKYIIKHQSSLISSNKIIILLLVMLEYCFNQPAQDIEPTSRDPGYESDPSNEYSLLGLTHVMNLIFLDPSDEFLTQVVNIRIPK